jgi:hypothetical protein
MGDLPNKQEACKTVIEQTKLLVALASGFLIAPAALVSYTAQRQGPRTGVVSFKAFVGAELFFISSVLAGYVVLGTIAGTQNSGDYNVYRPATRLFSVFQLGFYAIGLLAFVHLASAAFQ